MLSTGERRRVAGLDGLRAVAIVFVIVDHSDALGVGTAMGAVGVDIFFVLSGYLITGLLLSEWRDRGRIDLAGFWVRRACRLLPALLVAATTIEALRIAVGGSVAGAVGDWLAQVFYVANWAWVAGHMPVLMPHTWSLAVEEQFYLVWPLVVLAVAGRRRWLAVVIGGGLVASAVVRVVLSTPAGLTHLGVGTDSRGLAILAGCALAVSGRVIGRRVVLVGALIVLGVVGVVGRIPGYLETGWLVSIPAAVVAVAASTQGGLTWRPVVRFGRRSYAMYLWHYPILRLGLLVLGPTWGVGWLVGVPLLIVTAYGVAELSWRFVEAPAQAWGRRWVQARTKTGQMSIGLVEPGKTSTTIHLS